MKKTLKLIITILSFASFYQLANADAPIISSFTANPSSINSNQVTNISWQISGALGHRLNISCTDGVAFKNSISGSLIACGTPTYVSSNASDALPLQAYNWSGSQKSVTITLDATDEGGNQSGVRQSLTFNVSPASYPISSFGLSTTTVGTYSPVTLSWTGMENLPGVNFILGCSNDITATSSDYSSGTANIPCGTPVFSNNLAANGSLSLYFKNNNSNQRSIQLSIIPAINSSSYDATHSSSLSINVNPISSVAAPTVDNTNTNNQTTIPSGGTMTIGWSAHAQGVNIKFPCTTGLSIFSIANNSTTTLPCDSMAFQNHLPATGSTTLQFVNSNNVATPITFYILPEIESGLYSAVTAKTVSLSVFAPLIPVSTTPTYQTLNYQGTMIENNQKTSVSTGRTNFTKQLQRGSKNNEVTALQILLKKDPKIYPEGIVNGTFGPATERAVMRFQVKYGLTKKGQSGYGSVGPKTRAKLNEIE